MAETYKGGQKLPQDLDPKVRRNLEDLSRIVQRGIPTYEITGSIIGTAISPGVPGTPFLQRVITSTGIISRTDIAPSGIALVLDFQASPTVKNGTGNLRLTADFYPTKGDTLTLLSNGVEWIELSRSSAVTGTVIRPLSIDMTVIIQTILDKLAAGSVVTFLAGTYNVSDTITVDKALTLNGYGAVLDWGDTVLATDANWDEVPRTTAASFTPTDRELAALSVGNAFIVGHTTDAISHVTMSGFKLQRTATDDGPAASDRVATGLRVGRVTESSFRDLQVYNWENGLLIGGSNLGGTAHNEFHNLTTWNCRYAITGHQTGGGWANQNSFYGGRNHIESATRGVWNTPTPGIWNNRDASYPDDWELVRFIQDSGATFNVPNNNQFFGTSLEIDANRKLRLEGSDNQFISCRWENPTGFTGSIYITIGNEDKKSSFWRRNQFLNGHTLHELVGNNRIEFLADGNNINNANIFLTGGNSELAGNSNTGYARLEESAFRFKHSGNVTKSAIGIADPVTDVEQLRLYSSVESGVLGGLAFFEPVTYGVDPTDYRNYLALDDADPWDINIQQGVTIGRTAAGEGLTIRYADPHVTIDPANPAGQAKFVGSSTRAAGAITDIAPLVAINSASAKPSFEVQSSIADIRFRATAASGSDLGILEWLSGTAPDEVVINSIHCDNSSTNKPLLVEDSLIISSGKTVNTGTDYLRIGNPTTSAMLSIDSSGADYGFNIDGDGAAYNTLMAVRMSDQTIHFGNIDTGGATFNVGMDAEFSSRLTFNRTATATNYAMDTDDYFVGVTDTSVARTITLPNASVGGTLPGRQVHIVDESGNADVNAITVDTVGSDTVNGGTDVTLSGQYVAATFTSNGVDGWFQH